ncbi:MAG: FHA domain-containing protein [Candidatus Limiplasma sp.]|nr:FHA domain-containing protein [Candidatus Limiplasma sp.]MEA5145772.1 FHA domain-containing protein [Candidatus Limiplasma sp.]
MPDEVYEVVAQAARYWFLFLMALIAWRSYRWLARDRKQRRQRLKLLPDAGFVGELVVLKGNRDLAEGLALPIAHEGILGSVRADDVYVPVPGVAKRHLWFRFDEENGVMIQPFGNRTVLVDGRPPEDKRGRAYLTHGTRIQVGEAELRLRMFAGFEYAGAANAQAAAFADADEETPAAQPAAVASMPWAPWLGAVQAQGFTPAQFALLGQMGLLSPQGVPLITPAQLQAMLAAQPYAPAQAEAMAQLALLMQGYTPAQLQAVQQAQFQTQQPGYAPPTSAAMQAPVPGFAAMATPQAAVPGNALLQTDIGEFMPPPKSGKSGAILQQEPETLSAVEPTQAEALPRHPRANPLPPLAALDAPDEPITYDEPAEELWAADTPDDAAAQAADAFWDQAHGHQTAHRALEQGLFAPPAEDAEKDNPTYAPRVTFYPPEGEADADDALIPPLQGEALPDRIAPADTDAWPYATPPAHPVRLVDSGYTYPEYEAAPQSDEPYEYADEDEAPRSLYVEPDEAAKAKRLLWDKYLKGRREP